MTLGKFSALPARGEILGFVSGNWSKESVTTI